MGLNQTALVSALLVVASACRFRSYNNSSITNSDKDRSAAIAQSGFSFELNPDSFAQLDRLGSDFSKVDLVGLGEATHGTSEFSTFRHMFFRNLVEKYGYRLFLLEDELSGVLEMQEALESGMDEATAMRKLTKYGTFATEETRRLFAWIVHYNASHRDDPVVMYGVDMQNSQAVLKGLERLGREFPALAVSAQELSSGITELANCWGTPECIKKLEVSRFLDVANVARTFQRQVESLLEAAPRQRRRFLGLGYASFQLVKKFSLEFVDFSSADRGDAWEKSARAAIQKSGFFSGGCETSGWLCRDQSMVDNAQLALQIESRKGVMWGHNGHVARYLSNPEVFWWGSRDEAKVLENFGSITSKVMGNRYFVLVTDFYQGSFLARDQQDPASLREWSPKPVLTKESELQMVLHDLGHSHFAINLRNLALPAAQDLFSRPQRFRMVSAMFGASETINAESYGTGILPRYADAYVYFDTSTAHRPL